MECQLVEKAKNVAASLKEASYAVCYVGAGCSAGAGVPTFHGENAAGSLLNVREDSLHLKGYSHLCVEKLLEEGLIKFVLSTNHDGLLGTHKDVVEIFGSVLTEVCLNCNTRYVSQTESVKRLAVNGCFFSEGFEEKPQLHRSRGFVKNVVVN